MHQPDYPLRFVPIYQERIWGGNLHQTALGAPVAPGAKIGESWEISDRPVENSVVANGPLAGATLRSLIEKYPAALLGPSGSPQARFPLLIKFIGASDRSSLQVHPPDEYARLNCPGEQGKTEMWYILENLPETEVLVGFKKPQNLAEVKAAVGEKRLEELLNRVRVKPGDVFFLPAGRVHGIGAGVLFAEIQENSDLTYRVYDYGRRDPKGAPRDLQIEQALAVMDLNDTADGRLPAGAQESQGKLTRPLVTDEHFSSEHIVYRQSSPGKVRAGFQIAIGTQGTGRLVYGNKYEELQRGTVLLLPRVSRIGKSSPKNPKWVFYGRG